MPISTHETRFVLSAKDKTRGVVNGFKSSLNDVGKALTGIHSQLFGLASIGGLGYLIQQQAEGARSAIAYADALGVSTESLTRWQFAGQSVGLGADKIADIMKDTAEKIGDAFRNEGGEALEALESLGLSVEHINQLAPDQQLLAIARALEDVGTQGEKVQILEALASDASLLLPLLDDNAAELQRLIGLADKTGKTLTRVEADQLNEVNKVMSELNATGDGLAQTLAVKLAPTLVSLGREMTDFIDSFSSDEIQQWAIRVGGVLYALNETISKISTGYQMITEGIGGMFIPDSGIRGSAPGYQLGDFNRTGGDLQSLDVLNRTREVRDPETVKAMEENNRYQAEILEAIRNQSAVARAG